MVELAIEQVLSGATEAQAARLALVESLRRQGAQGLMAPTAALHLGSFELADDLLGGMPGAFHGRVPGPVWPDEDSHSPWTDHQGPRHIHCAASDLVLFRRRY